MSSCKVLGFNQIFANTIVFVVWSVRGCTLLLLGAACIITPLAAKAQERSERVFHPIPIASRQRLVKRLKQYIACEKAREYKKLYELIYDLDGKKASKETYITARKEVEDQRGIVQEFTPKFIVNVTINDADEPTFNILGIARVRWRGQTLRREMTIIARLHEGEWYFSQLSDSFLHTAKTSVK